MKEIVAPYPFRNEKLRKIFLGGSIEMGKAELWQQAVIERLADLDVCLLNPRRHDWNASWLPSDDTDLFNEQVNWELNAQESSDIIVYYFDPATKSPITLLELGLFAKTHDVIVCCPAEYWRSGNVRIVCERYGIRMCDSLDELVHILRYNITNWGNYGQK